VCVNLFSLLTDENGLRVINTTKYNSAAWSTYGLRPLEHWARVFESRSWHRCVSAFFCVSSGVRVPVGTRTFLLTTASRPALGPTEPPIQWVPWALSLGVKWPEREADHSLPSSVEVKNAWSYTSIQPIRLHGVVLSKKRVVLCRQRPKNVPKDLKIFIVLEVNFESEQARGHNKRSAKQQHNILNISLYMFRPLQTTIRGLIPPQPHTVIRGQSCIWWCKFVKFLNAHIAAASAVTDGAQENSWAWKVEGDRRTEKTAKWRAS
jgi:hypothetical protein